MKNKFTYSSFTLIELIIVILIISISYFLMLPSFKADTKKYKDKITLENLKEVLLKRYDFEKELSFICIEKEFSCYVKKDGSIIEKSKIKDFFKDEPYIYKYSNKEKYKKIEYPTIKIDNQEENVIFKLSINNDYKSNDFILELDDEHIYVFNSIYIKPLFYKSLSDVYRKFDDEISKVNYVL